MAYPYHNLNPGLDQNMMPVYNHHMEPIRSHSPLHGQGPSPPNRDLEASSFSKSSEDSKAKRSMSTPNIRTSANTDAAAFALVNDKRRNKLGYHRTSVACGKPFFNLSKTGCDLFFKSGSQIDEYNNLPFTGHCRRRKIRCIPAPADPQNRCSNCIRLKKECNFYPVDQQPQPEPKRRGSKAQNGTGGASQSSSPSIPSGQLPDMQPNLPYHLNMLVIQNLGGAQTKKETTESFSPGNKVVTSSQNFDYSGGHTAWVAPEVPPGNKTAADMPGSYWPANSQESQMTPAFSPYATPTMQMANTQSWQSRGHHGQPEANPREPEWSAPQRSVSYSHLEGIQTSSQNTAYGVPHPTDPYASARARALNDAMYPPNIATTHPHSAAEIPSTSTIGTAYTHSATPMSAGSYTGWDQPYVSGYAKVSPGVDTYASWHGSHGGQRIVEEEEGAVGYGGYVNSGGGVYYAGQPHAAGR
ncbi:hypothetical protein DSL72_001966 [Monilinia vaccinii-corymbosi]|uniref:Zn(2)-C6 fungal-type domain-containing protein n=1 Tax=Monilinia vaccinii-corymbosi TaxID=61207 RepID=A0A8A3PBA6_9HELO|nr:hypothetical protein DSL72_001966 [Monilinia vaccinii-corymbosi]